jgi:hypothetical protein
MEEQVARTEFHPHINVAISREQFSYLLAGEALGARALEMVDYALPQ